MWLAGWLAVTHSISHNKKEIQNFNKLKFVTFSLENVLEKTVLMEMYNHFMLTLSF